MQPSQAAPRIGGVVDGFASAPDPRHTGNSGPGVMAPTVIPRQRPPADDGAAWDNVMHYARETYLEIHGHHVWCAQVGPHTDGSPLLVIHGGPGAPHDYLEPLAGLTRCGRRVIFYDQTGCGHSSHPDSWWTPSVAYFVDELAAVRAALDLDRVHLFGHSWGGMLAQEYMLTQPHGVVSLTLASSLSSMQSWVREAHRLRATLPCEVQAALAVGERDATTDSPEYQQATRTFYRSFVCRLRPLPEPLTRAVEKFAADPRVYRHMWGANAFYPDGVLRDWDVTDRLHLIDVPTLITSGRYDESTSTISGMLHDNIPGSEWVVLDNSAHMAHLEEPGTYLDLVDGFLTRVERSARAVAV